jgi:hypothetical protein
MEKIQFHTNNMHHKLTKLHRFIQIPCKITYNIQNIILKIHIIFPLFLYSNYNILQMVIFMDLIVHTFFSKLHLMHYWDSLNWNENVIYYSNFSSVTCRYAIKHPRPQRLLFNFETQCKNIWTILRCFI